MPVTLPNPTFSDAAEICVSCGYSLFGLPAPGRCPECGTEFEPRQLVIFGVPQRSGGGSPGRRLCWIILIAAGILFSLFWPIFFIFSWILGLVVFLSIVVGVGYLLSTSKRERSGTERFVIGPSGIARLPLGRPGVGAEIDSVFSAWDGANNVRMTRVSSVWYRIQVRRIAFDGSIDRVVFDAGIRCPDDFAQPIAERIRSYLGVPVQARPAAIAQNPPG